MLFSRLGLDSIAFDLRRFVPGIDRFEGLCDWVVVSRYLWMIPEGILMV